MSDISGWAQTLIDANRSGADLVLPWDETPSLDDAYSVQDAVLEGLTADNGPLGGYKVAITAKPMQEMMGLTEPIGGLVHSGTIRESPFELSLADHVTPALEFEVTVRMGADVPASDVPYTRETIEPFVAEVLTSFEIVDTRRADISKLGAMGLAADRCLCAGAVLGSGTSDWSGLDLSSAAVELDWNGEIVETGVTGAAMGHPFEGLAWIANHLAGRGRTLDAGHVVLTGSAFAPKPASEGDVVSYRIEGLGEATVRVTA